jgi:hydrogenase maturation protease
VLDTTLVLGIGNDILTDDGIGPKLVSDLKHKYYLQEVVFQNVFLGGLEILELIQGYNTVIFIDAIITKDGIPGSIYCYTPDDFRETLHLSNLHDANFLVALELGRKMGYNVPDNVHIIAIEIVEDCVFSESFSPEIEEKYPGIVELVEKKVRSILRDT